MSNKMSRYTVPLTFIDGTSCGLCLEEFKAKDTVLDCHTGHVFHERCFARQKAHALQNVCPTCGASMHLMEIPSVVVENLDTQNNAINADSPHSSEDLKFFNA